MTLNVTEELNETCLTCIAVGESIEEREALLIVYGMIARADTCMHDNVYPIIMYRSPSLDLQYISALVDLISPGLSCSCQKYQ